MFGDYSDIPDFQVVRNQMAKGVEIFESLPARVRSMFDNDVALYCEFISDRNNLDKAIVTGKQIGRASCRERVSSPV